jgi:hypothetical protein
MPKVRPLNAIFIKWRTLVMQIWAFAGFLILGGKMLGGSADSLTIRSFCHIIATVLESENC